jgi:hypothetical protein
LQDGAGGKRPVMARAFGHHPIDGAAQLRLDLLG